MRIMISLSDERVKELDALAFENQRSRASLIKEAIDVYLDSHCTIAVRNNSFGLWKDLDADGLSYQEKLRSEW